jgi:hypothetical protein
MKRANCAVSLLAAVLAAAPLTVPAQMYKWVDAEGTVHYSDQPPPAQGAKQQRTLPKPRAAAPATAPAGDGTQAAAAPNRPKTPAEQEMEFRKRRLEAAEAEAKRQQEAEAAKEKQRNCDQAKARVATLQQGGRITRSTPSGEQIYLEDAEIARELVDARKVADSWCKD